MACFACALPAYRPRSRCRDAAPRPHAGERQCGLVGIAFLGEYGPVTHGGITFQGGYTDAVNSGDGDFMTADAVWDLKCSVKPPTKDHTLQIAMYWLVGLHSKFAPEYQKVTRLGFFNPRLATAYTVDVAGIPAEILHEIETRVICYDEGGDALF